MRGGNFSVSCVLLPLLAIYLPSGGAAECLGQPWVACWIKIRSRTETGAIIQKGQDSDKTFLLRGEAQDYYPQNKVHLKKPARFYLPLGSGLRCCHLERLLRILYYENFLFHDLCCLHLGTCYMSISGCCCSGKIHIYCPQFLRVYMRGGESHCHPDMVVAAVHPVGVFFSFSECSFLTMIKNLVTVSN